MVDERPTPPDEAGAWRPVAAPPQRAPRGKRRHGLLAAAIAAVVVVAAIIAVVAVLTAGGAAVVKQEALVASTPNKAEDLAAQSLLRNAMTAIDAAFVESADYTTITQSTLQAMEPAIAWMPGGTGASASPPAGAKALQNVVTWACTGRMTYEIGTWSASGVEFGVRVDKLGGGNTYYVGGAAAAW